MDGSRINDNTGLSVCIFPKDETLDIYLFKLNKNNIVFQVELVAIDFGVRWALGEHKSINIHSDTRSSIEVLRSARPRYASLNSVKNFYVAGDLVGFDWIKVHVGEPGIEFADRHEILATLEGKVLIIPTPYSYINFKICKDLIKNWQINWDNYDSESGGGSGFTYSVKIRNFYFIANF
ncbi:hypothetical protein AVEN_164719-1 [Araneus ventricosus]|uniref:Uncharacterized protein n=1 Tax=Araneus ventricosus TaxID=182803 RepID=A0A4Y2HJU5_ARAVE|nr:hypothetical protein AVEN_164719-1 [Araneus ventricosus]